MAERKLIWSKNAKIKLFEILDYFNGRNYSKTYSNTRQNPDNLQIK
jgi:hypothetical protein